MGKRKKVLFICNKGGHYSQMLLLKNLMIKCDSFVMSDKKNGEKDWNGVANYQYIDAYNIKKFRFYFFIKNLFQCFYYLLKTKPDFIVTTGAGLSIPMFCLGKIFNVKLIFIESRARVYSKSTTGKFISKISDYIIVQWPEMLEIYGSKARYYGTLV